MAPALSRGESAREGDPGVVAWAEGDRAGTRVAMQRGGEQSSRGVRGIVRETSAPVASGPYVGRVLQPVRRTDWRVRPKLLYAAQQPPPDDLLLVCRRRNV